MNSISFWGACTIKISASPALPKFKAAPVPTAITSTSIPVWFVNAGNNESRRPESRIDVVVAKIKLSLESVSEIHPLRGIVNNNKMVNPLLNDFI